MRGVAFSLRWQQEYDGVREGARHICFVKPSYEVVDAPWTSKYAWPSCRPVVTLMSAVPTAGFVDIPACFGVSSRHHLLSFLCFFLALSLELLRKLTHILRSTTLYPPPSVALADRLTLPTGSRCV